jgi:transcriptional regulator with XRE-family HTH domain
MKIEYLTPDAATLQELGKRLARIRKQHGMSQHKLAKEAGLGVATLRRIEAGEGSQLESWLKLMKALRMSSSIEALLPENFDSPMAEALSENKRVRIRGMKGKRWGDEVS